MAPHSSSLAWKIPWTEEPGRLQSMESWRVTHDWETSFSLLWTGEGNGNPLQCSYLENPRDGVAQSQTRLKWLSRLSISWLSGKESTCQCRRPRKDKYVFKKIGDIKGRFHARMDTIKDRNSKDLTEAEEIKKRWMNSSCTDELCKKDLNNLDNREGVVTHLEPDILKCGVKWAFRRFTTNKASGGDVIPAELFQILEDDAVEVLHTICQQIWKTQQWLCAVLC